MRCIFNGGCCLKLELVSVEGTALASDEADVDRNQKWLRIASNGWNTPLGLEMRLGLDVCGFSSSHPSSFYLGSC